MIRDAPLIIRADANWKVGTGHIMRCLALAQAWHDHGGKTVFITQCDSPPLKQRLFDEGCQVVDLQNCNLAKRDLEQTICVFDSYPGSWLVLDGYHFDSEYQRQIKQTGHPLLVIDDMADLGHYYADIVLNQNIYAEQLEYKCEPYTKLLLGTRYVLLRREFLKWQGYKRDIPEVAKKILVTMGGSDPDNVALKVLKSLEKIVVLDLEVIAILGPSNQNRDMIQRVADSSTVIIQLAEDPKNMSSLMARADLAVTAGGSTVWELAYMGVPTSVIVLAPNQQNNARYLEKSGGTVNFGFYNNLSLDTLSLTLKKLISNPEMRTSLANMSQKLVDGQGAIRVLTNLMDAELWLRDVRMNDCELIWRWANDPDVRDVSFSQDYISYDDHKKWFNEKLSDPACYFWIAVDQKDNLIGQIRFDARQNGSVDISISIAKEFRGKNYGSILIDIAVYKLFRKTTVKEVHAYIKLGNVRSLRVFEKARFKRVGMKNINGFLSLHYVRHK